MSFPLLEFLLWFYVKCPSSSGQTCDTVHQHLCFSCYCGLPSLIWNSRGRVLLQKMADPGVMLSFYACQWRLTWHLHLCTQSRLKHTPPQWKETPAYGPLYWQMWTASSVHICDLRGLLDAVDNFKWKDRCATSQFGGDTRGRTIKYTHRQKWGSHTYTSHHMHTVGRRRNSSLEDSWLYPSILVHPHPWPDVSSTGYYTDPLSSKPF